MTSFRPVVRDPKKEEKGPEPTVIHWRVESWFPDLGSKLPILKTFHTELMQSNKTVNLISGNTAPVADLVHFADSILAARIINKASGGQEIFDIGSGSGFPGLVYAILFPETKVHLVDVDSRKGDFLKAMTSKLALKNVELHIKNFEALPAEGIKFAMARSYAAIPKALLVARKVLALNGKFFHIKGTEWPLEIAEMPTQLCSFWNSGLVGEYSYPTGEQKGFVVGSEKIRN